MTKRYFIEGMSCSSCVAKVKAALKNIEGVESAEVQLQSPQATIKMESEIPTNIFQGALYKAGHYEIHEEEKPQRLQAKKAHSGCCR
ncbi:MAG: heavy metal-associated domain-containing protein [Ferruginibacter sp.]